MAEKWRYHTPKGFADVIMKSKDGYLTGLWFETSKNIEKAIAGCEMSLSPVIQQTIEWLDIYFSGEIPGFTPEYRIENASEFRKEVLSIMASIPYGKTVTYGDIANTIARKRGVEKMSAQAVGGAVGWNPISIIIPCHRVMGSNNAVTGYGGGIENKIGLLKLEKVLE